MIAVPVRQCLSRGSIRLHCPKMAEQIKMLFGVNTPGDTRNFMIDGGPGPPKRGTATARESCECSVCGAFDAAFVKLLWPPIAIIIICG